jgi:Raf kinase inhibitor-like YbhB/YbcL family protein
MERSSVQENIRVLRVDIEIAGLSSEETCEGPGFSPQVSIDDPQADHLALIMEDDGPPGNVYWLLWNVPRTETIPRNLPKVADLGNTINGQQGRNSRGDYGYAAPCPDPGQEGRYILRVYGLGRMVDLDPTITTKDDLLRAMSGHVREIGERQLVYSRKKQWSSSAEY